MRIYTYKRQQVKFTHIENALIFALCQVDGIKRATACGGGLHRCGKAQENYLHSEVAKQIK